MQWQLWRGGLGVPITYRGDASFYHSLTKTIADQGWFYDNPQVGAPYHQLLYDYPISAEGNLQFLGIRVLTWPSQDPFVVNNAFTLLTFPAVFVAAWFAFRRLRFSAGIACTAAVVYTLNPYHFVRRDLHPTLAAYFAVPLGCLLLYKLIDAGASVESPHRVTAGATGRVRIRRVLVSPWFWVPILLGSSGVYNAAFFSYLAVVIGFVVALRHRDWRRLVRPLLCVALTLGVLLANNVPTLVYQWRHGSNSEAYDRHLGENDASGLQLAYLVLPIDHHRIPAFAALKEKANESASPVHDPELQSLGLLGAVGLFVSGGALLLAGTGSRRNDHWGSLRRESGALNLTAIVLATVGGLSTLLGVFGFVQLRSYGRMSIFIAFFSLVALASAFESWVRRHDRGHRARAIAVVLVAVCVFAAFDQTAVIPTERRQAAAAVASDRAFVHRIERQLGGKGQVFELPLADFPETYLTSFSGEGFAGDELGKPALFSNSLRWSYGAMKGRPENLTPSFVNRPLESLLPDLAALRFDGIYIDRRGFPDYGAEIEARLDEITGASRIESDDGSKIFYDLRPYERGLPRASQAVREAALHPLELHWGHGFDPVDGNGQYYPQLNGVSSGRAGHQDAVLRIENTRSATRHLSLHTTVQRMDPTGAGRLDVRARRVKRVFDLSEDPTTITIELDIPPGTTTASFHVKGAGSASTTRSGPPVFQLMDAWWEAPFASAAQTTGRALVGGRL